MKIEKNTLELLDLLINKINNTFDKNEEIGIGNLGKLYEYISQDDLNEFLKIINKVKKGSVTRAIKISSVSKKKINNNTYVHQEKQIENKYSFEEISNIFNTFDNENINQRFKLVDLKDMYFSLFSEEPSKSKSKRDLINSIRNYFYSSNRANAFKL
jgi:hypothetical protein